MRILPVAMLLASLLAAPTYADEPEYPHGWLWFHRDTYPLSGPVESVTTRFSDELEWSYQETFAPDGWIREVQWRREGDVQATTTAEYTGILTLTTPDPPSFMPAKMTCTFDEARRLLVREEFDAAGNGVLLDDYSWYPPPDGLLFKRQQFNAFGETDLMYEYVQENPKLCTLRVYTGPDMTQEAAREIEVDDHQRVVMIRHIDFTIDPAAEGVVFESWITKIERWTRDDTGLVVAFSSDDLVHGMHTENSYHYTLDPQGNWVERVVTSVITASDGTRTEAADTTTREITYYVNP